MLRPIARHAGPTTATSSRWQAVAGVGIVPYDSGGTWRAISGPAARDPLSVDPYKTVIPAKAGIQPLAHGVRAAGNGTDVPFR